jgi:hypothetical protein
MTGAITITKETVDDIPILAASMVKIGVAALVDEHFLPNIN